MYSLSLDKYSCVTTTIIKIKNGSITLKILSCCPFGYTSLVSFSNPWYKSFVRHLICKYFLQACDLQKILWTVIDSKNFEFWWNMFIIMFPRIHHTFGAKCKMFD